jgi:mono/diheme cytochrome c family protein
MPGPRSLFALMVPLLIVQLSACAGNRSKVRFAPHRAQIFRTLCASCHGEDARGNGPVAASLKQAPSDLTTITARFDGHFPEEYVWQTIDGRAAQAAHGPREMPVWGNNLYYSHKPFDAEAREHAEELITELMAYLKSIQRKP